MARRYDDREIRAFVESVLERGDCVLPEHWPRATLDRWRDELRPLLDAHIARERGRTHRGAARHYVTLPFREPFADPAIFEDDDVLAIVAGLVGEGAVLCQLATDTPMLGSDYQDVHRDAPPLFPEWGRETPPFQLAVNFPLVDVTMENGPIEIARGTHMIPKAEALQRIERGEIALEPVPMKLGDVMIRDVRHLHRGTPNRTSEPRPMVVLGYSRRWLYRPEVSIRVPRPMLPQLSDRARSLLRFADLIDDVEREVTHERYQSFAY